MKAIVSLTIAALAAQVTSAADIFADAFARSLVSEFPTETFKNDSAAQEFSGVSQQGKEQGIFRRQSDTCVDPGYVLCSNVANKCCPAGWGCFASFGCCPSGTLPCTENPLKCYDPATDRCCTNGICDQEQTCCEKGCCNSTAYCGADGWCSGCPPAVETSTTTVESTDIRWFRVTVTEVEEPEEASEFTCPPMTVTNAQGATLELDEECSLSYSPPSTTSTSPAPTDANNAAAVLRVRSEAPPCTPTETSTEIMTVSRVTTSFSTTTITVTTSAPDFSCPTMAVTDSYGAILALDEACSLEYTPGSSTAVPSASTPRAGGGPVTTGGSERSIGRPLGGWWMLLAGFLGVL